MTIPITFTRNVPYWQRTREEWRQNWNLGVHLSERFGIKWWDWGDTPECK